MKHLSPATVVFGRLLAVVLMVAGVVVAWPPGPATAEAPDVVGWWNKAKPELPPDLGNPIPPPPDAPEDGFLVANDPTGPAAVAALRFEATGPRKAVLTLHAPEDSSFPANASLIACPVLGEWDQAYNGAWERRPELDCLTIGSPGEFDDDLTTVRFQINEEYFQLGVLVNRIEIGIRPERDYVQPFRAGFARPGPDALVAEGPLIEPPGSGEGGGVVAPPPALPPMAPAEPAPGGSSSFPDPLPDPVDTTVTGGPGSVVDDGPSVTTPVGQETAAPIGALGSTADRILAGALLAALGVGLLLVTVGPSREPRLLGGLAHRGAGAAAESAPMADDGAERGLGRFRRARAKAPVG